MYNKQQNLQEIKHADHMLEAVQLLLPPQIPPRNPVAVPKVATPVLRAAVPLKRALPSCTALPADWDSFRRCGNAVYQSSGYERQRFGSVY